MALTIPPMKDRIGTIGINNYGSKMIVEVYNNANDIWVRFVKSGNRIHTDWVSFCNGSVRNVYDKSAYGIGFIGEGKYNVSKNGKQTHQYSAWRNMLQRCYDEKLRNKYPTYKDCYVVEEWHNFQNFAKWYDQNYYEIAGEKMHLDKDILVKGNKIYSPETCIFVPQNINKLFINGNGNSGNLPIGIYFRKDTTKNPYRVLCNNGKGTQVKVGKFNTVEVAFAAYKEFKENLIKEISTENKDRIPEKLYNAMISYKVEFDVKNSF